MHRIRVPGLPAFGRFSTFPETNIRTYIVDPAGRRGVWFFSLDITRLVPALIARATYRLPYCFADMAIDRQGDIVEYRSWRRWPKGSAASHVRIQIGEFMTPDETTELDHFLSARWGLGSTFGRRLMWADVDHAQWPLHRAELLSCEETLVTAAGLPAPTGPGTAVWSPGVEVRIGRPRLVHRARPTP